MSDSETAAERGIGVDVVHRLRTEMGESDESIRAMPDATLQRAIQKLEHPDRARRRVEFELAAIRDDAGDIADGAVRRALEQASDLRSAHPAGQTCGLPTGDRHLPTTGAEVESTSALLPETAGLTAIAGWNEIGPDNIGGRTRAIVIDPDDTARIFAGSAGGGVWRSTDTGATWHPVDDDMGNLAVCSMVINPAAPNEMLAGTGEGYLNADALRGDGVFRTVDGGSTWAHIASTAGNADFHYVNALAYAADGTLFAGTRAGIFRSTDGGNSWTNTSSLPIGNLVCHPTDSSRAIAGTLRSGATSGAALFTVDGGLTWTRSTMPVPAPGRVQVCYAAADSDVTYASVDIAPSGIWRSSDGGQTYLAQSALSGGGPASFLGQQGWYDNVIWAGDPIDSDLVVVGGIDLWRSTDGGDHLVQISTWWSDDSAHADHHTIVSDPGYDGVANRRAYFGNDGGVYRAVDVTTVGNNASPPYNAGWNHLDGGYAVTQFYYGAGHVGTNSIVGGTQDNGTLRYTPASGTTWNRVYGGDGGACASDPTDPQTWYGEYVFLQVFRNSNGGASSAGTEFICGRHWNGARWVWKPEPFTIPDARDSNAQFIAPFVLDPNDADRLIGGGQSLWSTSDPKAPNTPTTGPSWRSIKAPIGSTQAHTITAIAVAPGDSDVIVVGHANGNVYRTTNGTASAPTWDRIDDAGVGANRQCLGLAIDPDDHGVVYASFGGYQPGNVWKTDDGGASWADISAGLPAAPARVVTLHPQRSSWVYLGTDVGVFASEDGGTTWSPTNEGPADVAVRDLFWLGCRLVAATHGRGMFEIDLVIAAAFPPPVLAFVGAEHYVANSLDFTRYRLDVTNWADYPSSLFRASPDLAPCGLNTSASRTWVDIFDGTTNQRIYGFCALDSNDDLRQIWFGLPRGTAPPASVYVVMRDRRCGQTYTSNSVVPVDDVAQSTVERRITMVDQIDNVIVRVGGPWGTASVDDVLQTIDDGSARYFIEEGGARATVSAVKGRTRRYLRSYGDRAAGNNLDSLPPVR